MVAISMSEVRFLLDTNVLSEPLKPAPDKGVMRGLERHQDCIVTASIVWHEMLFGLERLPRGRRKEMLREYLRGVLAPSVSILPYDTAAAAWHASSRAHLEKRGISIPFADAQVAAVAAVNDLTLVTRNIKHYGAFSELQIESWHAD